MGTRYRYLGRSWPDLPPRDIEADEAPSFGGILTDAAARGAYAPEYDHEPPPRKDEPQTVATAISEPLAKLVARKATPKR
jgi:hypothetical protein